MFLRLSSLSLKWEYHLTLCNSFREAQDKKNVNGPFKTCLLQKCAPTLGILMLCPLGHHCSCPVVSLHWLSVLLQSIFPEVLHKPSDGFPLSDCHLSPFPPSTWLRVVWPLPPLKGHLSVHPTLLRHALAQLASSPFHLKAFSHQDLRTAGSFPSLWSHLKSHLLRRALPDLLIKVVVAACLSGSRELIVKFSRILQAVYQV